MGRTPVYLISDADLLKQILVKEFSKFVNRPVAVSIYSCKLMKGLGFEETVVLCQQGIVEYYS